MHRREVDHCVCVDAVLVQGPPERNVAVKTSTGSQVLFLKDLTSSCPAKYSSLATRWHGRTSPLQYLGNIGLLTNINTKQITNNVQITLQMLNSEKGYESLQEKKKNRLTFLMTNSCSPSTCFARNNSNASASSQY